MSQSDLWEKAVVCAKAAHASSDPKRRAILIYLGEFWLDLARMDSFQFDASMAVNIAVIEQMHAELTGMVHTSH